MPNTAPGDGTAEHCYDMILNQQVSEALGAISAGESDHEGVSGKR
jgi:hypothetical protein